MSDIRYDEETGELFRVFKNNERLIHTPDSWGYLQVWYEGQTRPAHRVIWKMLNGEYPKGEIDHINRG